MKRITVLIALFAVISAACVSSAQPEKPALKFGGDGNFKVLLISDLDYTTKPDQASLALTAKLIDTEKPDLVVVNGDCVLGSECRNLSDVKAAVAQVASVMEAKKIPWAVTLGEHDHDTTARAGLPKADLMALYTAYPYNLNGGYVEGIRGWGNKCLQVRNSASGKPGFVIWLMDSGGMAKDPTDRYDWIHADQVGWYLDSAAKLEAENGKKVPGLMFFHIPTQQFNKMANSVRVTGQRHEPEDTSGVDGGIFMAVVDRGDVKGIFCGHNRMNDYVGNWMGLQLGFDLVAGFNNYPKVAPDDPTNNRARGGRVFVINQSNPEKFKTWMRYKDGTITQEPPEESWGPAPVVSLR